MAERMSDMYESGTWHGHCYAKVWYFWHMHVFRHHLRQSPGPSWKALVVITGALLTTTPHQANSAAINARTSALADVATAVALAKDGDLVVVPPGTAHWTSLLTITKGITLQGSTTVNGAGTKNPTVSDATTIIDDNTIKPTGIIQVKINPNQTARVTGFTFKAGTGLPAAGMVHLVSGSNTAPTTNVRVDHCHLVGFKNRGIQTDGWVY
jgi:hypothetical protein